LVSIEVQNGLLERSGRESKNLLFLLLSLSKDSVFLGIWYAVRKSESSGHTVAVNETRYKDTRIES
jgi:hypothetical protein